MVSDLGTGIAVGIAPIVIYLMLAKSWARSMVIILGGLFVLGAGSDISASKVIYAALILLACAIATYRLVTNPPSWISTFKPLIGVGVVLVGAMVIASLVSPNPASAETLARQAIFYLLVPAAPLVGLDAGRDLKPRVVYLIIAVVGTVAAIGFATDWLSRRGVSSLDVGRFVLSSLILPAFCFALALVQLACARGMARKLLWLMPTILIPIAMLVTGTRTNLIVLLAIFGVTGATRLHRVRLGQIIFIVTIVAGIGLLLFPIVANAVLSRPDFIQQRLAAAVQVLNGNTAEDQSFSGRSLQYSIAVDLIAKSPLFGYGPGFQAGQTLDTPLLTVAKLGILGTAVLAAFLITCVVVIMKSGKKYGYSVAHTASRGLVLVFLANIPFGTPIEDRGFGFTLILVFMAVSSEVQVRVFPVPQPPLLGSALPRIEVETLLR